MCLTHSNCKTNTARLLGEISVFLNKKLKLVFQELQWSEFGCWTLFSHNYFFFKWFPQL